MKYFYYRLSVLSLLLTAFFAMRAQTSDEPIITLHSTAYQEIGVDNKFSIFLGTYQDGVYRVDIGEGGYADINVEPATINTETGEYEGTWIPVFADEEGVMKIYGDPLNLNVLVIDGAYIDTIDMDACTNLMVISLQHNVLKSLDLTPFEQAFAIYLSDNPFSPESPLVVGGPKPGLMILELDITDNLSPDFNLSDYPALVTFDGYYNHSISSCDPTGCPNLKVLSLEMTNVSSLDVSKNPELLRLNISETRITSIDLSHNPLLEHLLANHDSGTINTDVKLSGIDISNNPELLIVNLNGNDFKEVDVSKNTKITHLYLKNNLLSSLDLSSNVNLYNVTLTNNYFDFSTLPLPQVTWGEYLYKQMPLPVPRQIEVGKPLDLSDRVLRRGTVTDAAVYTKPYDGEDELLDPSYYSYSNGVVTFNKIPSDSVYVCFKNDVFCDYPLYTSPMVVSTADQMGVPSKIVNFSMDVSSAQSIRFGVGMSGASPESPKTFYLDLGVGDMVECKAVSQDVESDSCFNVDLPKPEGFHGYVSIYIPEEEVMTALNVSGTTLYSLNVTKATELVALRASGCGLYSMDLKYNRCLVTLDLSHNNLYTLDLQGVYGDYEKNVLKYIDLSYNKLSDVNVISRLQVRKLDLSHNDFSEFSLKDFDKLEFVDMSSNKLSGDFSIAYQTAASHIDLSDNMITSLTYDEIPMTATLDITGNNIALSDMPLLPEGYDGYIYAPQREVQIDENAATVNLSAQQRVVDGVGSVFTWKKADGSVLAEGTDYTCSDGKTTFLNANIGQAYCEITNQAFPQFSGDNVLRTTLVNVKSNPTTLVAKFTTGHTGYEGSLVVTGTKKTTLYVDWKGDGSELTSYPVETSYISYDSIHTYNGAEVKVYSFDSPEDITVFSLEMILKDADFSELTGLTCLGLYNTGLETENLKLPQAQNLMELSISGAMLEDFPYAEMYPSLQFLNLSDNNITDFDASAVPTVMNLLLSDNELTHVKFNNPRLWNLSLAGNSLSEIDFSGLPELDQLNLNDNKLASIDLTPVKSKLRVLSVSNNLMNFATLPRVSELPALTLMYYTGQAPVEAVCSGGVIDLSYMADVDGYATDYTWYLGQPTYDSETAMWVGDLLTEGEQYSIANGVTTFSIVPDGEVVCLMTNSLYPSLTLQTVPVKVDAAGISSVFADGNDSVDVYSVTGILLRGNVRRAGATDGLAPGFYIVGGRKVAVGTGR